MSLAAVYDIHGNLPALEAVVEELRQLQVEAIVVGGDVLPGPMPRETIDYLLQLHLPVHFLRGNGDREVLAIMRGVPPLSVPERYREAMSWVAQQLHDSDAELLASWPDTLRFSVAGVGDVFFCHATASSDTAVFTRLTPDHRIEQAFPAVDATLIVCGHTHMQFDRTVGALRVVNAGSVGMPFGSPGADWLLLGPGVELKHTPYDTSEAAHRIRQTSYPQAEEFASGNILQPPSEAQMLRAFARVELQS